MKIKFYTQFLYSLLLLCPSLIYGAEWQWSVEIQQIISGETGGHPRAFLWIPADCKEVRGVVIGCHNMLEEGILEHPDFRKTMGELGFAEIWITPGLDPLFDNTQGTQEAFDGLLSSLADISGYEELNSVPVVPIGHSAYASYPWNYAAWNPERTLAILSIKGDSPRTHLTGCGRPNLDWEGRTVEGIPGLIVMGEYEWWTDRLITAFDYRLEYPSAPVSVLADAGRGHFDISDPFVNYLALFIRKAAEKRLSDKSNLVRIDAREGWLAPCWSPKPVLQDIPAAPYEQYTGKKEEAFWYFDEEMVRETEKIYAAARGKKEMNIGFCQNGELLAYNAQQHARISANFKPAEDGLTFHLSALFTDSLRTKEEKEHAVTPILINRICGPVEKVNDTTFTIRFYRMGLDNQKRTGDIWLIAENEGDETYKSTVQQLNIRIPHRNEEGMEQHISFPEIGNIQKGVTGLSLHATASSGLPVYYYIKEGPAIIQGNQIEITPIPPKSRFPVKVTVVAWQYGRWTSPAVQTAPPVERSFYITE